MSIRIKLILTYVAMVTLSVIIVTVAGMTMMAAAISGVVEAIQEEAPIEDVFYSAVDILADFKQVETYDPEKITDVTFAESINEKAQTFSGFLITEIDGQYHSYSDQILSEQFYEKLKLVPGRTTNYQHGDMNNLIDEGDQTFVVIKHTFTTTAEPINYYLAVDVSRIKQNVSKSYGLGFIKVLIALILIIVLPIVWITSRDIIRPLRKLEEGANHIKQGNLDFTMTSKNYNEIGRVIRAFEKMRVELKKSIESQLQVEDNRKELISNISHDLKTPITSIKGYVEGIRDGVAQSPEKLAKYLDVIYHKSEDMDHLIDDLFLFSKLDLKRVPFDLEKVQLLPFYQSCMEELHLEYDKKGIHITSNYAANENATLTMDSQKIKRVILNVVNNAIKFMDKEEKLLDINFT
ncbi:MAG: HAMP domain-containing histidine kinase, partial [Vallitaleaceae bacterium]|nr:HAMP domain-containing histidine kinase [Vallitaleaceae bacterium]